MTPRRCFVCGRERRVLRFQLIRAVDRDGRHTTRGAGGITLCEPCWRELRRRG